MSLLKCLSGRILCVNGIQTLGRYCQHYNILFFSCFCFSIKMPSIPKNFKTGNFQVSTDLWVLIALHMYHLSGYYSGIYTSNMINFCHIIWLHGNCLLIQFAILEFCLQCRLTSENLFQISQQPRTLSGTTTFIANERGHLMDGVPRSRRNPWGSFVGTWDLPRRIPGECPTATLVWLLERQNLAIKIVHLLGKDISCNVSLLIFRPLSPCSHSQIHICSGVISSWTAECKMGDKRREKECHSEKFGSCEFHTLSSRNGWLLAFLFSYFSLIAIPL